MQVDTSRDRGDILSEKTLKNIGEGDQVTDPTVKMAVGGLDNKVLIPGSPKSPKSLKKRQQSRKAKYGKYRFLFTLLLIQLSLISSLWQTDWSVPAVENR